MAITEDPNSGRSTSERARRFGAFLVGAVFTLAMGGFGVFVYSGQGLGDLDRPPAQVYTAF